MMNLVHWRLIVAVADAGAISRAAERVGMTQSGASQAIAQMEKTLGAKLFTRSRGGIRRSARPIRRAAPVHPLARGNQCDRLW